MKKSIVVVMLLAVLVCLSGCVNTQAGKDGKVLKRRGLFANVEFEEAVVDCNTTITYYSNGVPVRMENSIDKYNFKGFKSDTQKALETANKALDTLKTMAENMP